MKRLPHVRNENIAVQHLNDEILIYDLKTNEAVCLNSTSAIVFNHCDGKTTFDELKGKYKFDDNLIYFTLDKLSENNLLENYHSGVHFAGLSRREVIRRVGLGSMIALPVISMLIAPSAAHAASTAGTQLNGTTCTNPGGSSQCASSICTPTTSGTRCCYAAVGPGNATLNAPNDLRSASTSVATCGGAPQRSFCCSNATTSSATPGNPGACNCA